MSLINYDLLKRPGNRGEVVYRRYGASGPITTNHLVAYYHFYWIYDPITISKSSFTHELGKGVDDQNQTKVMKIGLRDGAAVVVVVVVVVV